MSTVAKCSIATVTPCVSYSGPDIHSNMAVLDVTLPSGYIADRASLYKLTEAGEESSEFEVFSVSENSIGILNNIFQYLILRDLQRRLDTLFHF